MKWSIPAKTFLVGEYAALAGQSAIVLTTAPCFELELISQRSLQGIHPSSPAGKLWNQFDSFSQGLVWKDPYQGIGGLGASSAQFLAVYLAICVLSQTKPNLDALLEAYYQCAWQGQGIRPSGYDLLAQAQNACVYLNRAKQTLRPYVWPFKDLAFLLVHSGKKLATHEHLRSIDLADSVTELAAIADLAESAFVEANNQKLVQAINAYHQKLTQLQLVAAHSLKHIEAFEAQPEVLAVKGCGALGADVILLIVPKLYLASKRQELQLAGWTLLATSENLYLGQPLIQNNDYKTLEILA